MMVVKPKSHTTVVPKIEPENTPTEEDNSISNALPKQKNVVGRLVKTVGKIVRNNDKSKKKKLNVQVVDIL